MLFKTCNLNILNILKNVGNQATLAPIDFTCMDTKPLKHLNNMLFCVSQKKSHIEVLNIWVNKW